MPEHASSSGAGTRDPRGIPTPLGGDHAIEILAAIRDEAARATACRLFMQERLEELEKLLRWDGLLRDEGLLDETRLPELCFDSLATLETEADQIAGFSHDYGYNSLSIRRRGWLLQYVLNEDSCVSVVRETTLPLEPREVADLLLNCHVVDYVRECARDAGEDSTGIRWEASDPEIDVHLAAESDAYDEALEDEEQEELRSTVAEGLDDPELEAIGPSEEGRDEDIARPQVAADTHVPESDELALAVIRRELRRS
jgi:hypothetical protein